MLPSTFNENIEIFQTEESNKNSKIIFNRGPKEDTYFSNIPCQILKAKDGTALLYLSFGALEKDEVGYLMQMKKKEQRFTGDFVAFLQDEGIDFQFKVTNLMSEAIMVDFLHEGQQMNQINVFYQFDTCNFNQDRRTGRRMNLKSSVDQTTGEKKTLKDHEDEIRGKKGVRENFRVRLKLHPKSIQQANLIKDAIWTTERVFKVKNNTYRNHAPPRSAANNRSRSRSYDRRGRSRDRARNRPTSYSPTSPTYSPRSPPRNPNPLLVLKKHSPNRNPIHSSTGPTYYSASSPDYSPRRNDNDLNIIRSRSRSESRSRDENSRRNNNVQLNENENKENTSQYEAVVNNLKLGKLNYGKKAPKINSVLCNEAFLSRRAQIWIIDLGIADFFVAPPRTAEELKKIGKEQHKKEEEKNKKSYDASECVICLDHIPNTLILPCSHKCVCEECLFHENKIIRLNTCPCCRSLIDAVMKVESNAEN